MQSAVVLGRISASAPDALGCVADMAAGYPFAHNVLGTPAARAYAARMAEHAHGDWYGLFADRWPQVAAHLALYGQGDGRGHSLWKIRHPLALPDADRVALWARLLDALVDQALVLRPGSVKVVLFLSEHEHDAGRAAERAGFAVEGRLRDFYRMEELCLIYGRTAKS